MKNFVLKLYALMCALICVTFTGSAAALAQGALAGDGGAGSDRLPVPPLAQQQAAPINVTPINITTVFQDCSRTPTLCHVFLAEALAMLDGSDTDLPPATTNLLISQLATIAVGVVQDNPDLGPEFGGKLGGTLQVLASALRPDPVQGGQDPVQLAAILTDLATDLASGNASGIDLSAIAGSPA